jgi:hypothetical protein
VIGSYRDADDARHELVVRQTADGDWRVLDVDADAQTTHMVDTLAGNHDGRPQAEAIARDYLTTVGATAETGRPAVGAIPGQGGSDARCHRRPRSRPRQKARGAALPRAAS